MICHAEKGHTGKLILLSLVDHPQFGIGPLGQEDHKSGNIFKKTETLKGGGIVFFFYSSIDPVGHNI